jgi:hypothetical protein
MKFDLEFAGRIDDGPRRAALAMHALPEGDQAWILQQLPLAQRERLRDLVAELRSLGIPANRSFVEEMLAMPPGRPASSHAPSQEAPLAHADAVARLDAALVARVLKAEPPGVIAHLVDVQRWPWQDALLEQLGPAKRRRVEEALDGLRRSLRAKAPESLNRSLLAGLLARAQEEAPPPAPVAVQAATEAPTRSSRWRQALRRFGARA